MGIADVDFMSYCFLADTNKQKQLFVFSNVLTKDDYYRSGLLQVQTFEKTESYRASLKTLLQCQYRTSPKTLVAVQMQRWQLLLPSLYLHCNRLFGLSQKKHLPERQMLLIICPIWDYDGCRFVFVQHSHVSTLLTT